jgi:phospholipid transport system substrate-binding protein
MLRRSLLTGAALLIPALMAPTVSVVAGTDPAAFIESLDQQLEAVVRNSPPEELLARFHLLFHEEFDVPGIARFVLGRYWRSATPSQQQEFVSLFEDYIVQTYSDRLSRYADGGDALRVTGSRLAPEGAVVSCQINLANGGGPKAGGHGPTVLPIRFDWLLTAQNGFYKICDVIVDGISMAVTQRSEFASEIQRDGGEVQGLLAMMHRTTAAGPR